jgi:hypothetical protein
MIMQQNNVDYKSLNQQPAAVLNGKSNHSNVYQNWLENNKLEIIHALEAACLNWLNQQIQDAGHDLLDSIQQTSHGKFETIPINGNKSKSKCGYAFDKKDTFLFVVTFNDLKNGCKQSFNTGETLSELWNHGKPNLNVATIKFNSQPIVKPVNPDKVANKQATDQKALESDLKLFDSLPNTGTSKYLQKKGLLETKGADVRFGKDKHGYFIALLIQDIDGNRRGIQKIYDNGGKFFTKGMIKEGCYILIDGNPNSINICEGFATGLSLHLITGNSIFCALDAHNILSVALALKSWLESTQAKSLVTIAADNDLKLPTDKNQQNIGIIKAKEAAIATGFQLSYPTLDNVKCDFNDIHVKHGLDSVLQILSTNRIDNQVEINNLDVTKPPFTIEFELPSIVPPAINPIMPSTITPHSNEEIPVFWDFETNEKTGKVTVAIDRLKLIEFFNANGYRRVFPNGEFSSEKSLLCKVTDNIIERVTPESINETTQLFVKNCQIAPLSKEMVLNTLIKHTKTLFRDDNFESIESNRKPFHNDTQHECFFYFLNCFVRVTATEIKALPYSEMNGLIWKDKQVQRNFIISNNEQGIFYQFQYNTCKQNKHDPDYKRINEKFLSLRSIMGYALHRYFSKSLTKAIILNDEVIGLNEGGSGKTLNGKAIGQLRSIVEINGKEFDHNDRFRYQDLSESTDFVMFDDVKQKFNFETLYHTVTSGYSKQDKGSKQVKLKQPIKTMITTNHVIKGDNGSDKRRKIEFELTPYYDNNFSPRNEFGGDFWGENWDANEWASFDVYMFGCVSIYLQHNLIECESKNLAFKRLIQKTSNEFVEFAKDNLFVDITFDIKEMFARFKIEYPDFEKHLKQRTFTVWIQAYATHENLGLKEWHSGDNQFKQLVNRC